MRYYGILSRELGLVGVPGNDRVCCVICDAVMNKDAATVERHLISDQHIHDCEPEHAALLTQFRAQLCCFFCDSRHLGETCKVVLAHRKVAGYMKTETLMQEFPDRGEWIYPIYKGLMKYEVERVGIRFLERGARWLWRIEIDPMPEGSDTVEPDSIHRIRLVPRS